MPPNAARINAENEATDPNRASMTTTSPAKRRSVRSYKGGYGFTCSRKAIQRAPDLLHKLILDEVALIQSCKRYAYHTTLAAKGSKESTCFRSHCFKVFANKGLIELHRSCIPTTPIRLRGHCCVDRPNGGCSRRGRKLNELGEERNKLNLDAFSVRRRGSFDDVVLRVGALGEVGALAVHVDIRCHRLILKDQVANAQVVAAPVTRRRMMGLNPLSGRVAGRELEADGVRNLCV